MAGGTGTRLWPLSRDNKPKQFQAFVGEKTMLQQTYERLGFLSKKDIFVSTNKKYVAVVREQLPDLPRSHIIIEPAMRDTGPSICYTAHVLNELGHGDEVMALIYADHLIQNKQAFRSSLNAAAELAHSTGMFGVIGVRAKYANPTLGYIRMGKLLKKHRSVDIYQLDSFVEKPTLEKAKQFLHSYKYLWNTGLYVGGVSNFLEGFKTFSPEIYKAIVTHRQYEKSPKISIDYAVIEQLGPSKMFVIPADLGWNDIGNWRALHEELTAHDDETLAVGQHLGIETEGCLVVGQKKKLIATFGLSNIVIIDTPDALLVIDKKRAGEVKQIVNELREKKRGRYL